MELSVKYQYEQLFIESTKFIPNFFELLQALRKNKSLLPQGTYVLMVDYKKISDLLQEALVGFLKKTTSSARIGVYLVPKTKEIGYVWVPKKYRLPAAMIPRSTMERELENHVTNLFKKISKLQQAKKTRLCKKGVFKTNFPSLSGNGKNTFLKPNWRKKNVPAFSANQDGKRYSSEKRIENVKLAAKMTLAKKKTEKKVKTSKILKEDDDYSEKIDAFWDTNDPIWDTIFEEDDDYSEEDDDYSEEDDDYSEEDDDYSEEDDAFLKEDDPFMKKCDAFLEECDALLDAYA
jgi:hypothetical protein